MTFFFFLPINDLKQRMDGLLSPKDDCFKTLQALSPGIKSCGAFHGRDSALA
jgi:hypothetical protein